MSSDGNDGHAVVQDAFRLVMAALAGILIPALIAYWLVHGTASAAFVSRDAPALVPGSAEDLSRRADDLVKERKFGEAEQAALAALRLSPFDSRALRALAASREARDQGQSDAILGTAAVLGWRDPDTQIWLMNRYLALGDPANAVLRADALARTGSHTSAAYEFLRKLAGSPATRPYVLGRLAEGPSWRPTFFVDSSISDPSSAPLLADLMRALRNSQSPAQRIEVAHLTSQLAKTNKLGDAHALWLELLAPELRPAGEMVADPRFAATGIYALPARQRTPFEWTFRSSPRGTAGVRLSDRGEGRLFLEASGGGRDVFAEQVLALPPGSYLLAVSAAEVAGDARGAVAWSLSCNRETALAGVRIAEAGRATAAFSVPPGCPFQTLELTVQSPRADQFVTAEFQEVSVQPAEQAGR